MNATNADESVGFIGLGALGTPIAQNLLASGVRLTVWNRTASKAEPLSAKGARVATEPKGAVPRGGVVFTILWDDASLEEIVSADGFLDALGPGGLHVSMTTVTPAMARKVAALHESRGSLYLEAPIFGIPAQAVARKLTVCLAGAAAAKERARPLLTAMGAERTFDFGEAIGAATATKLAGNYLIVSSFAVMHEVFDALVANGVDPKPTLEMLTTTLLATPGNQRYAGYLLSGAPMPTSGIPAKDVGLFQRFAAAGDSPSPVASEIGKALAARASR